MPTRLGSHAGCNEQSTESKNFYAFEFVLVASGCGEHWFLSEKLLKLGEGRPCVEMCKAQADFLSHVEGRRQSLATVFRKGQKHEQHGM